MRGRCGPPLGRDGPPSSYRSWTPYFSASRSTVSVNERPSIFITNVMTSPPVWQPKQWKNCRDGFTLKEGDFSSWNGHRPLNEPPPALRRVTYCETTSSMRALSRTSAMSSSRIRPAPSRSLRGASDLSAAARSVTNMSKVTYYTATTVDGFIADADNSLQWLFDVPNDEDD